MSQAVTSNESAGVDVKTKTPTTYSNFEPVKDESTEKQKTETERSQGNVLVNQLVTSEKSNIVEPVQVAPVGISGKSVDRSLD